MRPAASSSSALLRLSALLLLASACLALLARSLGPRLRGGPAGDNGGGFGVWCQPSGRLTGATAPPAGGGATSKPVFGRVALGSEGGASSMAGSELLEGQLHIGGGGTALADEQLRAKLRGQGGGDVDSGRQAAGSAEGGSFFASAVSAVAEVPLWARIAAAGAATYLLLVGALLPGGGDARQPAGLRPTTVATSWPRDLPVKGFNIPSAAAPEPAVQELVPNAFVGAGTLYIEEPDYREVDWREALQIEVADALPRFQAAATKSVESMARSGLRVASATACFTADSLPVAGDLLHNTMQAAVLPGFQAITHAAADATRALADSLSGGDQVPARAAVKHACGQALQGASSALHAVADAAPQLEQTVSYTAGKTMPVVQASLRAVANVAADAAKYGL